MNATTHTTSPRDSSRFGKTFPPIAAQEAFEPTEDDRAAIVDALDTLRVWILACGGADSLHGVSDARPTADLLWGSMQAVLAALDRVQGDMPHEFHLARGTLQAIELFLCAYAQRESGAIEDGSWALEPPTALRGAATYAGRLLAGLWAKKEHSI